MGTCVSGPLPIEAAAIVQPSHQEDFDSELRHDRSRDYAEQEIESIPPDNFFPESEEEVRCKKIVRDLLSDENIDSRVNNILISWEESELLSRIDSHVLSVSALNRMTTIRELAAALTASNSGYLQEIEKKKFVNLAKAYAIYSWISNNITFDIEKWKFALNSENVDKLNEHTILRKLQGLSEDFSSLFSALCTESGLRAQTVEGNLRRWKSLTGEDFKPIEGNRHVWNVIRIDKENILIDCTLGSGYISPTLDYVKDFTRHYFGIAPGYHIISHWPTKISCQFLKVSLSLQDLQPIIPVSVRTLNLGLMPQTWTEKINVAQDNSNPLASLSLMLNKSDDNMYIKAKLISQSLQIPWCDMELQRCVFIRKNNDCEYKIEIALPESGSYILNIYMCNKKRDCPDLLCLSYIIESNLTPNDKIGYPFVHTLAAEAFKFKPIYWNAKKSYNCVTGRLFSLVFQSDVDLSFHHSLIQGKVNDPSTAEPGKVFNFNTSIVSNRKGLFKLLASFPYKGWWAVCLSATRMMGNDEVVSGYTSLLNYQVYAEDGSEKSSFPKNYMPRNIFFDTNPVLKADDDLLMVPFASSKTFSFLSFLTYEQPSGEALEGYSNIDAVDEYDNTTFQHYNLNVFFPKEGIWFVHVYRQQNEVDSSILFQLKVAVGRPISNVIMVQCDNLLKKEYEIEFINGSTIIFEDDKQPFSFCFLALSHIKLMQYLKLQDQSFDNLTFLSSTQVDEGHSNYTLSVLFPKTGKWTLEVYAVKEGDAHNMIFHMHFAITKPLSDCCYPKIHPAYNSYNISILNQHALLRSCYKTSELKMPFQAPEQILFFWKMENTSGSDYSQQAFVHCIPESENRILRALFPEEGEWKLDLYAKRLSSIQSDYEPVLTLSVKSSAHESNYSSFPMLYESQHRIFFAPEDLPLPSVITVRKNPMNLFIKFCIPSDVALRHYATIETVNENENETEIKQVLTRMTTNIENNIRRLEIEVATVGHWTVFLYIKNVDDQPDDEWTAVMQYNFTAL